MHARWLGEKNGSMIAVGLVSGILCASLATFMTPWASPVVVLLLAASALREFLHSRKSTPGLAETFAQTSKSKSSAGKAKEPDT